MINKPQKLVFCPIFLLLCRCRNLPLRVVSRLPFYCLPQKKNTQKMQKVQKKQKTARLRATIWPKVNNQQLSYTFALT